MKIIIALMSLVSLIGCSVIHTKDRGSNVKVRDTSFAARKGSELKKRVTILPFINLSSYKSPTFTEEARAYFITQVQKADEMVITDVSSLGVDKLESYQSGNGYNYQELAKKIRASGVHAIVVGTIKDLRTGKKGDSVGLFRKIKAEVRAVVELQVIAVRSGQVMITEMREADLSETQTRVAERAFKDADLQDNPDAVQFVVETAFEKTIPPLIDSLKRFSWEGRVALVKGERVYLNAGRQSGLQLGDVLRIVEQQEEVFDPQNDKFIGNIKGRMKGTVEVVSYFGEDGAVTVIHSGSGFKENDLVEFY